MKNHFLKPANEYSRDLNVVKNYKEDMALFLSKRTGKPLEVCQEYMERETGKGGKFELKEPRALCLTRNKHGDRVKEAIPYSEYLRDIVENKRLMSPAMTVYLNPEDKPSILAEYISQNIANRARVKKEGIAAKMAGDQTLADIKENEQTTFKIANNSLSGAQVSPHTILYNKSAHSSLTSTCRTATSYGNANNEKFLCGNRHYWCPDVVKANIVSILRHVDYDLIKQAMDHFNLHYPTPEEALECVTYSTDLYWKNEQEISEIYELLKGLTPLERATFIYVGDLYHLRKYNDDVVRKFIGTLSTKAATPLDDPAPYMTNLDNDTKAFVSLLCTKELNGEVLDKLADKDPEAYAKIAHTVKNTFECLDQHQLLIKAFWTTDNVPASIAYLRDSIRRAAVTSDTDSTIFTTQDWVEWYVGEINFTEEANAVSYAMVYLATQAIIHVLAIQSTIMGVVPDKLNVLAMKNEYAFPVFSLTAMAKHYYSYMSAREGNVFKEFDLEIKGVYLKDSNCPPAVMKQAQDLICDIMDNVIAGKKMSINALYQLIAGVEKQIIDSIKSGSSEYLAGGSVKDIGSYTNPSSSPYQHYLLWQAIFAPVYGDAPPPPYSAVRISLDINNKTQMQAWVDSIQNPDIKENLIRWMKEQNKTVIPTLLLPRPVVEMVGIPKEIVQGMDIRKIVFSITRPFYLILESLGIYMKNDNNTRLIYDTVYGETI